MENEVSGWSVCRSTHSGDGVQKLSLAMERERWAVAGVNQNPNS